MKATPRPTQGDVVTNLQYQIDELNSKIHNIEEDIKWLDEKADLVSKDIGKIRVRTLLNGEGLYGCYISGLCDSNAQALSPPYTFTDEQGYINAYIASGSKTISVVNMLDIVPASETLTVEAGKKYELSFDLRPRNYLLLTSSTTNYTSSNCVSMTGTMVGGGGGGGSAITVYGSGSGGGGGGFTRIPRTIVTPKTAYRFSIGGGGGGGASNGVTVSDGNPGGTTSFSDFSAGGGGGGATGPTNSTSNYNKLYAGGSGGTGDVTGPKGGSLGVYGGTTPAGYPPTGGNGMSGFYISFTESTSVSGGGGYGRKSGSPAYAGGAPGGGNGACYDLGIYPESGKTYGGGGGGAALGFATVAGASGYRGAIGLRLTLLHTD